MDVIFQEIRDGFGLSNKHVQILECVKSKEMDAKQICKETGIPQGRIYSYLNDLVNLHLIDKSTKKPYVYSMIDVEQNVMNFLKYRFDNLVDRQQKIMSVIEKKTKIQNVEQISSGEDFGFKLIQLLQESPFIRTVVRHGSIPFPLYPSGYQNFHKAREAIVNHRLTMAHTSHQLTSMIHRAYVDFYRKGKKFYGIVERSALYLNFDIIKKHLGKAFLKQMINDIRKRINDYDINIYVVNEYIPMRISISNKKVLLSIIHLGITTGTMIGSNEIVTLYRNFFDEMMERGTELSKFLDEYKV